MYGSASNNQPHNPKAQNHNHERLDALKKVLEDMKCLRGELSKVDDKVKKSVNDECSDLASKVEQLNDVVKMQANHIEFLKLELTKKAQEADIKLLDVKEELYKVIESDLARMYEADEIDITPGTTPRATPRVKANEELLAKNEELTNKLMALTNKFDELEKKVTVKEHHVRKLVRAPSVTRQ